jgi:hypothetical protein
MGVVRRDYVESLLSRRAYAKPLGQSVEIVSEIGDDIRIYLDDTLTGVLENGFWGGRRGHVCEFGGMPDSFLLARKNLSSG